MIRSADRLAAVMLFNFEEASQRGPPAEPLLVASDAVYHFAQDAWHLADWLKADACADTSGLTSRVGKSKPLRVCRDLAVGVKHYVATSPPMSGSVPVLLPPMVDSEADKPDIWSLEFSLQLEREEVPVRRWVTDVIDEWEGILVKLGLDETAGAHHHHESPRGEVSPS